MSVQTTQQVFDLAVQHHQAGRLVQAEALYRQILLKEPNNADALHLLGLVTHQLGRPDAGIELIRRALALRPDAGAYWTNLALALMETRQFDQAIPAAHRAAELEPQSAEAQNLLGSVLHEGGRAVEAIAALERAVKLHPKYPEAHFNMGNALLAANRLDDAAAAYRRAISLQPHYPQAHCNLGSVLQKQSKMEEAIDCYRKAIEQDPGYADAYNNLGSVFEKQLRYDEAVATYRQALVRAPEHAQAHSNLGLALYKQHKYDQTIICLRRAIELKPDFSPPHNFLGNTFRAMGRLDEAIASYRRAVALCPTDRDMHWDLASALLLQGNFPEGNVEHEWRPLVEDSAFEVPRWNGEELNGRRILIHFEQGFGDNIQFIRYAPLIKKRGGVVLFWCAKQLSRLMKCVQGIDEVLTIEDPMPQFDVHCPVMSLPLVFKTTLQTIPADIPYIRIDPALIEHWRLKFAGEPRRKIGLVWAGNPTHINDRLRSMPIQFLAPLKQVADVQFYSLQKYPRGVSPDRDAAVAKELKLVDWTGELDNYVDTGAMISNLDLVIAVDTSVAHLAGALGRPVWIMIPYMPDFRWMLNRDDSPWYPTARLFRQRRPGDWSSVVEQLLAALDQEKSS